MISFITTYQSAPIATHFGVGTHSFDTSKEVMITNTARQRSTFAASLLILHIEAITASLFGARTNGGT